jgi:hypothetical protein
MSRKLLFSMAVLLSAGSVYAAPEVKAPAAPAAPQAPAATAPAQPQQRVVRTYSQDPTMVSSAPRRMRTSRTPLYLLPKSDPRRFDSH